MSKKLTKKNKIIRTILITILLSVVVAIVEEVDFLYYITMLLWLYLLFRIWVKPKNNKSTKLKNLNTVEVKKDSKNDNTQEIEQENSSMHDSHKIYDFSCIDFETANDNMSSACSIGIVCVVNNEIVIEYYSLIKPKELRVNSKNFTIHGISENMLINEKEFPNIWNEVSDIINKSKYVVAHNAQFDMSVLFETTKQYSIEVDSFKYIDSINICSSYSKGVSNKLIDIANYFGVNNGNHHNALDDAKTAALCVIESLKIVKFDSLHDYVTRIPMISVNEFKNLNSNSKFQSRKFRSVKIGDVTTENTIFDEMHPFFGKLVVITGDFENYPRREMMQMVLDVGGIVRSSVSRKTDILIVGDQDKNIVGVDGLSSKQEKALTLIDQGYNIVIIGKDEFKNIMKEEIKKK